MHVGQVQAACGGLLGNVCVAQVDNSSDTVRACQPLKVVVRRDTADVQSGGYLMSARQGGKRVGSGLSTRNYVLGRDQQDYEQQPYPGLPHEDSAWLPATATDGRPCRDGRPGFPRSTRCHLPPQEAPLTASARTASVRSADLAHVFFAAT